MKGPTIIRMVIALPLGGGVAVVLAGCLGAQVYEIHVYTEDDRGNTVDRYYQQVEKPYWYDEGNRATEDGVVYTAKITDPGGNFDVSISRRSIKGSAARSVFEALGLTTVRGRFAYAYHARSDSVSLSGIAVMSATDRAGSVCLSMSGASAPGGRD